MAEKNHVNRCGWLDTGDALYVRYHDEEWGKPVHDDGKLYEMLILECFQAGLSWLTILRKREAFRTAYEGFRPDAVAAWGPEKVEELMQNPGIIRNRRKIEASITNTRVFLEIQREYGSFSGYLWGFTGGKIVRESWDVRTTSPLSDAVAKDLKKRGMRFVGSTTIYAYLQSIGILNAHDETCFLYPGS